MSGERFSVDPAMKAFISDLRLSTRRILRSAHLPEGLFGRETVQLTPAEYYRLWSALESEGGDRNLAVDVGAAISVETFSPPILAALCSPNLSVAAHRIASFKPLIGPLRLEVDDDPTTGVAITYQWPLSLRPPDLLAMSELVFWAALARIATRRHIRPVRVTVPHIPSGIVALEQYFGARIIQDEHYTITFNPIDAARGFMTENETMWRIFAPELRRSLSELNANATVSERVRAALVESLPAGDSSMTTVANALTVSSRTLQRQLQSEGLTYKAVLATTREQLAKDYLRQPNLTAAQIAYLLGYEDTNSFYRAFRSWTGATPESLRKELLGTTP